MHPLAIKARGGIEHEGEQEKKQRNMREKKSENEKKNRGERTTREKYYRKGGNIGREERFRVRETLSPRRLKP